MSPRLGPLAFSRCPQRLHLWLVDRGSTVATGTRPPRQPCSACSRAGERRTTSAGDGAAFCVPACGRGCRSGPRRPWWRRAPRTGQRGGAVPAETFLATRHLTQVPFGRPGAFRLKRAAQAERTGLDFAPAERSEEVGLGGHGGAHNAEVNANQLSPVGGISGAGAWPTTTWSHSRPLGPTQRGRANEQAGSPAPHHRAEWTATPAGAQKRTAALRTHQQGGSSPNARRSGRPHGATMDTTPSTPGGHAPYRTQRLRWPSRGRNRPTVQGDRLWHAQRRRSHGDVRHR